MQSFHIQGGRVLDPATGLDNIQDVFVAQGKIIAIGEKPTGFIADTILDAAGSWVLPALVDLAARLREPGFEYMATLESEMDAAVAGGIAHLVCPPDTDPVLDEPGLVEMLKHRARQLNQSFVYPLGALTQQLKGEKITEMAELAEAGCVAFSQADAPITDLRTLLRALQYAATFGFVVWLRPQDFFLARDGVAHEGEVSTRLGLNPIPVSAETIAIQNILTLVQQTSAQVHLCRLSSAAGIDLVRQAKQQGLRVSCDVSVYHLHLTDNDIGFFDSAYHLIPPLRSVADRAAIWEGLQDGTIDAICSDHTPVDADEKLRPFAESAAGATGLELLFPLVWQWAEMQNIPLNLALSKITHAPAQLLGIKAGQLSLGGHADICIFNPRQEWQVSADTLKSQGRNTPYFDKRLQGRVQYTLIRGDLVYSI